MGYGILCQDEVKCAHRDRSEPSPEWQGADIELSQSGYRATLYLIYVGGHVM
jgi:hypothetical protein